MDVENKTLKKILINGTKNYINTKETIIINKITGEEIENIFFTEKSLGSLEKDKDLICFRKLTVKVIDFDETEKKLRKGKTRSRKSCDAIKFVSNTNKAEIHFIELKSIKNLEKDTSIKTGEDRRKKIENFKLYKKIRDSILIMSEVIEHKNMKLTTFDIENYYKTLKQPIVLVDINKDSQEGFKFTLEFLAIKNELDKIGKNDAHNLQEAKLAHCDDFDEKYNN